MRSSSSFVSSYLFVSGGVWSLLLGLGMTIPSLTGSYQSVPFLEALLSSITQALASSLIRLVAAANNCISRPVSCGLYQPSSIQVTNFALHLAHCIQSCVVFQMTVVLARRLWEIPEPPDVILKCTHLAQMIASHIERNSRRYKWVILLSGPFGGPLSPGRYLSGCPGWAIL